MNLKNLSTEELNYLLDHYSDIQYELQNRIPRPNFVGNIGDCYCKNIGDGTILIRIDQLNTHKAFVTKIYAGDADIERTYEEISHEVFEYYSKIDSELFNKWDNLISQYNNECIQLSKKYAKQMLNLIIQNNNL